MDREKETATTRRIIVPGRARIAVARAGSAAVRFCRAVVPVLVCLLLVCALVIGYKAGLLIDEIKFTLAESRPQVAATFSNVEQLSASGARAFASMEATADKQREIFLNPRVERSFRLLLQSGDDLNRGVKKFNVLLDQVNDDTVPRVNTLITTGSGAVEALGKTSDAVTLAVNRHSVQFEVMLDRSNSIMRQVDERMADPRLNRIMDGWAASADQVPVLMNKFGITQDEINAKLPEFLTFLNQLAKNGGRISEVIADYAEKKEARFILILKIAARIALATLPVLK